jgi:hypothetical protein
MSTLVSEIIVQAFREGNFTPVGESTTAEELVEAIPRLNNLLAALFGIELVEQLREWYVPNSYSPEAPLRHPLTPSGDGTTSGVSYQYPPPNVRLVTKITSAKTIYFPPFPGDGARMAYADVGSTNLITLDGNGRLIEGATSIVGSAAADPDPAEFHGRQWLYRADIGDWIHLKVFDAGGLEADDEVHTPPEFDDLLVCGLCMRLAARMGVKDLDAGISGRYTDMLGRLKKRYKQSERMPSTMELRDTFRSLSLQTGL